MGIIHNFLVTPNSFLQQAPVLSGTADKTKLYKVRYKTPDKTCVIGHQQYSEENTVKLQKKEK